MKLNMDFDSALDSQHSAFCKLTLSNVADTFKISKIYSCTSRSSIDMGHCKKTAITGINNALKEGDLDRRVLKQFISA